MLLLVLTVVVKVASGVPALDGFLCSIMLRLGIRTAFFSLGMLMVS